MDLRKKEKEEVTQVYDTWLNSYLNGDVKTYDSFFDDRYHFIGSTDNENFLNRKDTTKFLEVTADQLAGKTEIRNNRRIIEKFDGLIFITELFDAYFLIANEWAYYGKFRFTSALQKKKEGWRFIYQHFSTPDAKAQEGETIGTERIAAENQMLREAVKRRTVELEHKTRELEIEAALERVRAHAMGLRKSEELRNIIAVIFEELKKLGLSLYESAIFIREGNTRDFTCWGSSEGAELAESYRFPYFDHPIFNHLLQDIERNITYREFKVAGEEVREFGRLLFSLTDFKDAPQEYKDAYYSLDKFYVAQAIMKHGYLEAVGTEPLPADLSEVLKRFTNVVDLTYTRFLDLQKAEAQAYEAQVESALERIRSQVTAMKESAELLDIVVTMRTEFLSLGHEAHYFWYMRYLPETYEKAMTSGDGTRIGMVMSLPRHIHGDIKLLDEWEKSDDPTVVFAMDVETAVGYIHKMITLGDFKQVDPNAPTLDDIRHIGGLTFVMARTTYGEIGYSLPGTVTDPPQADLETLVRFASVFDLAYLRFEDLKTAEKQNRETQIELALERVRSRTMAMQRSEELQEAAALLFHQVKELGVPAFSCGYNIWEKGDKECTAWMASQDDKGIDPAFKIPLTEDANFIRFYESKRKGEDFYVLEMRGEKMQKHYQYLRRTVPVFDQTFNELEKAGISLPEAQIHHLVNFDHGNVMFITLEPCPDAHDIFKRLGKVFEQTYTRFLDLQKAEALARQAELDLVKLKTEKKRTEDALSELKATQTQLIHAEKMASLGELTAGIAHEIQNPLNFVNNFSDVSVDLINEMADEIESGNIEEVMAIAGDLKQNLGKITFHGQRASSIVKGMLEHSRASSGQKEPTDLNALADEYLRLAYHGLRAKDKSFQSGFYADLDDRLPKIKVVPQDIGRVLLNMINNAFYAVSAKALAKADGNYNPMVLVSTKNLGGQVEIRVKDNGDGVPAGILDKIFQPFFTTKPTGEGTGLGLSMSYDIITKGHGGKLSVETTEGKGSTFIISIPITI